MATKGSTLTVGKVQQNGTKSIGLGQKGKGEDTKENQVAQEKVPENPAVITTDKTNGHSGKQVPVPIAVSFEIIIYNYIRYL